jgi:hypothetical protein
MSEDQIQVSETVEVVKVVELPVGGRGELGVATSSLTIKQKWHEAYFDLVDVGDKRNPRKQQWVRKHHAISLKKFARQLISQGDILAKNWWEAKGGALNAKRSDANEVLARTCAAATKLEKRKKSVGGGKK